MANQGVDWWQFDPRPDIADDHELWSKLLMNARALYGNDPHGLYGALHGLRCLGACLTLQGDVLRLSGGDIGAEYPKLRETWLVPHAEQLRRLLKDLGALLGRRAS